MSAVTPAPPACPDCQGEHLWNWLWRHTTDCPLGEADSGTRASDAERLVTAVTFTRKARRAELELADLYGWSPDVATFRHMTDPTPTTQEPTTTVRRSGGAVPHRMVAGIDPDDHGTWSTDDDD